MLIGVRSIERLESRQLLSVAAAVTRPIPTVTHHAVIQETKGAGDYGGDGCHLQRRSGRHVYGDHQLGRQIHHQRLGGRQWKRELCRDWLITTI